VRDDKIEVEELVRHRGDAHDFESVTIAAALLLDLDLV
jgi:hypothetical protein